MSKQDALDALNEFFGNSRRVDDPQGQPRQRVYIQGIVDSVWHATVGKLPGKDPAKTLDWLRRPVAEVSTPELQAVAKAVADELDRRTRQRLG